MMVLAQPSMGLNPQSPISQYLIRNWTTDNGLPRNNVLTGTQTTDGFLWFGGYAGLVRFDGVQFKTFNSQNEKAFTNDAIYEVYADAENRLWVGTQGNGLVVYEQGEFHQALQDSTLRGINIFALSADAEGNLWLATSKGVLKYRDGSTTAFPELAAIQDMTLSDIAVDAQGHVWIGTTGDGLYRFVGQALERMDDQLGLTSNAIYSISIHDDNILVGTLNSLAILHPDGSLEAQYSNEPGQPSRSLGATYLDGYGALWVGGQDGIGRLANGKWTPFLQDGANLFNEVSDIFLDNQDNLWISTYRDGIWQVSNSMFTNYSEPEGLTSGIVHTTLGEEDVTWIGTESGLWEMRGEEFQRHTWGEDNLIRTLFRDSEDQLWLGTYGGLLQWDNGVVQQYGVAEGLNNDQVRDIEEDSLGRLWIATRSGLYRLEAGVISLPEEVQDLASQYILSLFMDSQQRLWIGTNGNGLYRWDGQDLVRYVREDGLGNNFVFRITEGPSGAIWIGTTGGLTRFQHETLATLTVDEGLPTNVLFQPIRAGDTLWAVGDANLWSARFTDLHARLDSVASDLPSLSVLDKFDGLLSEEPTSVSESTLSPNGEIVFCMPKGISALDLANQQNRKPPTMLMDLVVTDRERLHQPQGISLAKGNRQMTLYFTAFDYRAPDALRFQHRLLGFDSEWKTVDGGRYVTYTNLSPGDYEFQLRVSRTPGQWAGEVFSLAVTQEAFFYQTRGFLLVITILFVGLVVGVAWGRTRLLSLRNKRLEQMVTERTHQVEKQKESIERQAHKLKTSNEKITSSIRYARRIQDALLPDSQLLQNWFPESFILYLPKDVVSGDFYWLVSDDNKLFVAAVDCTGHGVPGAFMSVLGHTLLSQIVTQQKVHQPSAILQELHKQTILQLQQHEDASNVRKDGMDLALTVIDKTNGTLTYAGAKRPLVYMNQEGLQIIKGDRFSIGDRPRGEFGDDLPFQDHKLPLEEVKQIFLFSDGYADQFSEKDNQKFMVRNLYQLLDKIADLPAEEQKNKLHETLMSWKGKNSQIDDVLLMGVTLN